MAVTEAQVIEALKQCMDPEIPVDIWNLGLIYSVFIKNPEAEQTAVTIIMTLTTPGCAMKNHIAGDIKSKVSAVSGVTQVDVEFVFDPRWTPAMISAEARQKLGI